MSQPAARITDMHVCPAMSPNPHISGVILPPGKFNVLIGNLPAAPITTMAACPGPPNMILPPGSPTVLIGGLPAARMGDPTVHGGTVILGCFTVFIGMGGGGAGTMGTGGAGTTGLGTKGGSTNVGSSNPGPT